MFMIIAYYRNVSANHSEEFFASEKDAQLANSILLPIISLFRQNNVLIDYIHFCDNYPIIFIYVIDILLSNEFVS